MSSPNGSPARASSPTPVACAATSAAKRHATSKVTRSDLLIKKLDRFTTDDIVDTSKAVSDQTFDHRSWMLQVKQHIKEIQNIPINLEMELKKNKYQSYKPNEEYSKLQKHSEEKQLFAKTKQLELILNQMEAYEQTTPIVRSPTPVTPITTPPRNIQTIHPPQNLHIDSPIPTSDEDEDQFSANEEESGFRRLTFANGNDHTPAENFATPAAQIATPAASEQSHYTTEITTAYRPKGIIRKTTTPVNQQNNQNDTLNLILQALTQNKVDSDNQFKAMQEASDSQIQSMQNTINQMQLRLDQQDRYARSETSDGIDFTEPVFTHQTQTQKDKNTPEEEDPLESLMIKLYSKSYVEDMKNMDHSEYKKPIPKIERFDGTAKRFPEFMAAFDLHYGSNKANTAAFKLDQLKNLCTGIARLAIESCKPGPEGYRRAIKELHLQYSAEDNLENQLGAELISLVSKGTTPEDYLELYYKLNNVVELMKQSNLYTNQLVYRTLIPHKFSKSIQTRLQTAREKVARDFSVEQLLDKIKIYVISDNQRAIAEASLANIIQNNTSYNHKQSNYSEQSDSSIKSDTSEEEDEPSSSSCQAAVPSSSSTPSSSSHHQA